MDKFYRGSAFALDVRYAQVLNTVFVTMMYGAGMPLLLPVCAVTLALTFLLDKYMLLYFYNTDLLDCLNGDLALSAASKKTHLTSRRNPAFFNTKIASTCILEVL